MAHDFTIYAVHGQKKQWREDAYSDQIYDIRYAFPPKISEAEAAAAGIQFEIWDKPQPGREGAAMHYHYWILHESPADIACFSGYAGGLMYHAFGYPEHDAGVSGDGWSGVITRGEAINGLQKAIDGFDSMHYPDPTRMDGIKNFFKRVVNGDLRTETEFKISFS